MTAPFQVMPDLSPDEYAALREDIREHGITVPIVYDQDDRIIDGHHRARIAEELGIDSDDIPWTVVHIETDEELRSLAYRLNIHRRHLTREQKRAALETSLKADPGLSDRQHAERIGVSHTTAATVRGEMESTGQIGQSETRRSADGRERPATQPARPAPEPKFVEPAPEPTPEPAPKPVAAQQHAPRPVETIHLPDPEPEPEPDPEPVAAQPIREPEPAAPSVEEYLSGQQSVQDAMYVDSFCKKLRRFGEVTLFDPDRLADLLEEIDAQMIDRYATELSQFNDRVKRKRSTLRVVAGGKP